jgi:protein SCO1
MDGSTTSVTRIVSSIGKNLVLTMMIVVASAVTLTGCRQPAQNAQDVEEGGGFEVRDAADCLPDITLVDQNGHNVSLASLKGKPVLFDFIYTSCPGPCLLLTSRMKQIADRLGPKLGTEARIVSITVDPEHDHPEQLNAYAKAQGADVNGWLFLTGTSKQIDDVLAHFDVIRQHEADGTVDHVLEFFLVDANGHALLQYMGEKAEPDRVASDVERAVAHEPMAAGAGAIVHSRGNFNQWSAREPLLPSEFKPPHTTIVAGSAPVFLSDQFI